MPRRRSKTRDRIEQDFLDAIERLKDGRPQNPELREKVRKGKTVKINIATVAQEAGRARGLIGIENCRYPEVRQLVLIEADTPGVAPGNRDDVIKKLRAEIAELRMRHVQAEAHAAYHFDLRTKAEKKAAEYKGRYERLKAKVPAVEGGDQGKVVPIFPEQEQVDAE
ncbi:hypothetical protein GBZ26_06050 [Azospirillum formosense]|uniref:Uncharacterized protein n=1 Tax=Azospirillum formosense TaxID=861533 RepID=A0ABX2KSX2_9PROT|nr:hypothetical protein [Azospirillum formosense]MBY3754368.1 hypothetical protein [Azospirillum formosense]NUB18777.1 hypothetical protein [Azospirillum formosense]